MKRKLDYKPKWQFVITRNDAVDEHVKMPWVTGLFDGDGFCWLGIVTRPNGASEYHGEWGIIIANRFIGWWWDEYPEEWTKENG